MVGEGVVWSAVTCGKFGVSLLADIGPLVGVLWGGFKPMCAVGMNTSTVDVKEVVMEVGSGAVGDSMVGGKTRRRRGGGRRRTRAATANEHDQMGGGTDVAVEKDGVSGSAPAPAPVVPAQTGGTVKAKAVVATKPVLATKPVVAAPAPAPAKVVIAPPKKKPAKLLFVPKHKVAAPGHRIAAAKTFKARRVSVTIDNTAKTQKRRTQTMQRVDGMSEDQLRAAAVSAKLSRRETVAKVPVDLLRQMLKDYYMMRGMLF